MLWHSYKKKLLILLKVNGAEKAEGPCKAIIKRFNLRKDRYEVVKCEGSGNDAESKMEADVKRVRKALEKLGWRSQ